MMHLPIEKEAIPYSADIRIAGITYTFTFQYNSEGDFFTVDLARNADILALGEKIIYGKALFSSYLDARFPILPIIPLDMSMQAERVGWQELGTSVQLY